MFCVTDKHLISSRTGDTAINVLRNSVDGLQTVMEDFVKEQTERIHKLRTELNTLEKHRFDEKRKRTRRKCNEIIMGNTTGEVSTSSPQPLCKSIQSLAPETF